MTSDDNTSDSIKYEHEFVGSISPEITISDRSHILIVSKDQSYLTHGIHKFPAKFFPELPRYLVQKYSAKGNIVLDPMCGSGTVLLESLLLQRKAVGIDIDPMARLISRVKITPISSSQLTSIYDLLREVIIDSYDQKSEVGTIPDFHYRDSWFRPYVLHELGVIKNSIEGLSRSYDRHIFDFLRVVFSSIIRDVSNADPHCTRTVIRKKQKRNILRGEAISKFLETLENQIESMENLSEKISKLEWFIPQIFCSTATSMPLKDTMVDLAITSPPYINAVDYPRTHQLEMYWLGFIEDEPLSKMKRRYIGTETVYKEEYLERQISNYTTLDNVLRRIFKSDPRRSFIVYKFFDDMKKQLSETYRVLRPGAKYCLAIGNNLIRGIRVESHKILSEIATSSSIGFKLERSFFSGLIRHFIKIPRKERMHGEWVLILEKPK